MSYDIFYVNNKPFIRANNLIIIIICFISGVIAEDWQLKYEYYRIDTKGHGLFLNKFKDEDGFIDKNKLSKVAKDWTREKVAVYVYGSCLVGDRQLLVSESTQNRGVVKIKIDASRNLKNADLNIYALNIHEYTFEMSGFDGLPPSKDGQKYNEFSLINHNYFVPFAQISSDNESGEISSISLMIISFEIIP